MTNVTPAAANLPASFGDSGIRGFRDSSSLRPSPQRSPLSTGERGQEPDAHLSRRACLGWAATSLLAPALLRADCPCGQEGNAPAPATQPAAPATRPASNVLRISADPNNLPFSNREHEGFEDKVAALVAADLGMELQYDWLPQRLGFYREALKTRDSNLVMAAPAGFEKALTTRPYYRSTYAFVYRKDKGLAIRSLDDPALRTLKIGVQLTGGANTPPAIALGRRGLVDNVTGFPVFDESAGRPSEKIIAAVASGEVDVAICWGPPAGYFAKQQTVPLAIVPVEPQEEPNGLKFAFEICMGVRRSDKELRDRVNDVLARRQSDIDKILDGYGVPRAPASDEHHAAAGVAGEIAR